MLTLHTSLTYCYLSSFCIRQPIYPLHPQLNVWQSQILANQVFRNSPQSSQHGLHAIRQRSSFQHAPFWSKPESPSTFNLLETNPRRQSWYWNRSRSPGQWWSINGRDQRRWRKRLIVALWTMGQTPLWSCNEGPVGAACCSFALWFLPKECSLVDFRWTLMIADISSIF